VHRRYRARKERRAAVKAQATERRSLATITANSVTLLPTPFAQADVDSDSK